jgi:hypothetical protein
LQDTCKWLSLYFLLFCEEFDMSSLINSSARKWIFLAGALCLVCLGIDAAAHEFFAPKFVRSEPLPLPADWPTTTIYSRVNDWVEAGGGPVPSNLTRAVEVYPEFVAFCVILNRKNIPDDQKARIAQGAGCSSIRFGIDELEKFVISNDESIVRLKSTYDMLRYEDRVAIWRSVLSEELHKLKDYPPKPRHQVVPNLAQNNP